jgi:hypothetical protein
MYKFNTVQLETDIIPNLHENYCSGRVIKTD